MLPPTFKRRATPAWSMARRLPSDSTTLATALTIPVNIHVPRDQQIGSERCHIQPAKRDRFGQALDAGSSQRSRRSSPADELGGDVSVDFVDQTTRKE